MFPSVHEILKRLRSDGYSVEVPADAKLYIDDRLMKTSAAKRTFNTPTLEEGQLYYYILRAELTRDGQTYSETKRVIVRSGAMSARRPGASVWSGAAR